MALTSLYTGLSGMSANSLQLSAIGNNLANSNTTGYKSSTVAFQDLLSQTLTGGSSSGTINFLQIGLGVGSVANNSNFGQGSLQATGINTNTAIQGEGFFIVKDNQNTGYTRGGDFHVDASGYLVTSDGATVQGYIDRDPVSNKIINSGTLSDITVPSGILYPPIATSTTSMLTNLDSSDTLNLPYSNSVRVFDSLGQSHQVTFTWTRTAALTYSYDVTIDGGDVAGGTAGTPVSLIPTGVTPTMTFDANGELTQVDGATPTTNIALSTPAFTNGAAALNFNWQILNADGTAKISNFAAPSSTSSSSQNGFAPGKLNQIVIGRDGTIQGIFDSGQTIEMARIALATFNNPSGLVKMGNNRYGVSVASGEPSLGEPGTGGRGTTAGSTVELSNVDIATEFINMIVAQRGYQANSRMVTTSDEVLQEAINMKR
jgi:flagellar hook protein FlgE